MKKLLLFSFLALAIVFSAKAMLSSNKTIVEKPVSILENSDNDMICHWCVVENNGTFCASASTCNAAKAQARRMATKQ